jgi:uncharacterized membrane protein
MSIGAAESASGAESASELAEDKVEKIKAANAASENYGNFYGQNLLPVQSGVQLVATTLATLGYSIDPLRLVFFTIPVVVASVILAVVQFLLLDRRLAAKESPK